MDGTQAFTLLHSAVYGIDIGNTVDLVALMNINDQVHNMIS